MDYCDVFISCLGSHYDGTHSLQRILWWASDGMHSKFSFLGELYIIFLHSQVNWSWILRYFYWNIRWKYWPRNWFYFITGRNLLLYVWITLNAAYVESLTWGCFLSYFLKLDMYEYQSPGRIITQFAINTSSKDTWIFVGTGNLYTSCMCHHASILGFWQIIMI